GAMAPIITWAAATDGTALTPILLFLIVFLWTPPHFWALALFCKDDYKNAQLPMMPLTRGDEATINQIIWYALAMVIASLTMIFAEAGVIYALVALTLGTVFLKKSIELRRENTLSRQRGLFGYSIVYLFALFLAIVIDGVV
ncbi:MAG: UbiA family prenyltransferase, partial [candidate division Zixibacteria bacterium]|nr:UbiA family prenyltransferase [candidate division Zixibacteria bacterium]